MISEFIEACRVDKQRLWLPPREDFELPQAAYTKFKKLIQSIGGRYQVGGNWFDFDFEPGDLLERLQSGENYAKALQFFPTTPVACGEVEKVVPRIRGRWLEPSGGRGALVDVIRKVNAGLDVTIDVCEIDSVNRLLLEKKGIRLIGQDFMDLHTMPNEKYDGIVMNPPFSNGQYMMHILRAYDHLKPGGNLTFIAPTEWMDSTKEVHQDFRDAIAPFAGVMEVLPKGAFRESGTNIDTVLVNVHRPLYDYTYAYQARRKEPAWAATIDDEALEEVRQYFTVIDRKGMESLTLYDVRLAASNLGFPFDEAFCQSLHGALTLNLGKYSAPEPEPQAIEPVWEFDF
jgi:hypothetical protein